MVTVTWGQNQVYTFNNTAAAAAPGATPAAAGPATAAPGFGTTPAAPAGVGSAPAPSLSLGGLFGSASPAPAPGGSLFGSSTPAPAPGGSLFGTPTPASGSFFGSSMPAPASTGFGFGSAPAPAFGSAPAASSLFAPAPAPGFGFHPTATPQIPAQAAMQAHLDASARQEAAKLQAALETLNAAYTGAPSADSKHKFVAIFFDDISLEQRQMQLLMGGQRPPKSPHVSEKEWLDAIVRNPDPEQYMPVAYVGAEALQTRIARAQDKSNTFSKGVETLHLTRETLARNCTRAQSDLRGLSRQHATLRTKLLEVMSKVELARNMNLPRQVDEEKMNQRLVAALHQVNQIQTLVAMAQSKAKSQSHSRPALVVNVPDERELARVLTGHRESLTSMVKVMEKDTRDVNLLKQHLASNVPLPPR